MPVLNRVESSSDRSDFARDADMGQVSLISVLAGTLVAYAAFAILLAVVAAVLAAIGVDTAGLTSNDWREAGITGGIIAAVVLLLSYFFGGYVAGRMARRGGALNGGLVFLLAVLIAVGVGALVGSQANTEGLADNLRSLGVPTTGSEYGDIATVAGIAAILAMLLGAVLGGKAGERWHGKLATRAFAPAASGTVPRRDADEHDHARQTDDHDREHRTEGLSSRPWATGGQSWGDQRRDDETAVAPAPTDDYGSGSTSAGSAGSAPRRRERPLRAPSPRNR
jgi:hypothetical protein